MTTFSTIALRSLATTTAIDYINNALATSGYPHLVNQDIFEVECELYRLAGEYKQARNSAYWDTLMLAEFITEAMEVLDGLEG